MLRRHPPQRGYRVWAMLWGLRIAAFEPLAAVERVRLGRSIPGPRHPPVFVLGFWRSGTTHLQSTLLSDPRWGYLKFYHALNPSSFVHTEAWMKPFLDFFLGLGGMIHPAHQVPLRLDLPAEEDVAFPAAGFRLAPCWGMVFQDRFRELYRKTGLLEGLSAYDRQLFGDYLERFLGRVSIANDHRPLLLKSPPHTGRLPLLNERFPDARYVFIRRDPYEVFRSNLKLWESFDDQRMRRITREQKWANIAWLYDRIHSNYERDKHLLGDRLVEVTYEDFAADPTSVLDHIHDGLALPPARPGQYESYLSEHHRPPPRSASDEVVGYVDAHLGHWVDHWGARR